MTENNHPRLHVIDGGGARSPGRRRYVRMIDELPEGVVAEVSADRLAELRKLIDDLNSETAQSAKMAIASDIIVKAKQVCISQDELRSMREDGER